MNKLQKAAIALLVGFNSVTAVDTAYQLSQPAQASKPFIAFRLVDAFARTSVGEALGQHQAGVMAEQLAALGGVILGFPGGIVGGLLASSGSALDRFPS